MQAWDQLWRSKEGQALWPEPNPFVVSLLQEFKKDGKDKVLDIGFGMGRHAILFAKEGFDVYGIDTSPTALEQTVERSQKEKVAPKLRIGEMSDLPFDGSFFDLILAWNVMYHGTVDYIRKAVSEIERCLKPSGYLLCTLISTRHKKYGLGGEIERNTFVIAEDREKCDAHHYFDLEEINRYFESFVLLQCEDIEQLDLAENLRPGSFHWHILAKYQGPRLKPLV